MSDRGPLVIAHRGASHELPEHTLAAQKLAIEQGADAIECDVRLTADLELVCVHDARLDRTSNGRGFVSSRTLAELRQWDFHTWKSGSPAHPAPHPDRSVLTLDTLLELVRSSGRAIGLSIETKHPSRHSRILEEKVVAALRRHGVVHGRAQPPDEPGAVRVMSFSQRALERMHALAPTVPTVYLTTSPSADHLRGRRLPGGAAVLGPWLEWIRRHPVESARYIDTGGTLHVWTVDERADVMLCADLGVGAIITNRPASTLRALGRGGAPDAAPTSGD